MTPLLPEPSSVVPLLPSAWPAQTATTLPSAGEFCCTLVGGVLSGHLSVGQAHLSEPTPPSFIISKAVRAFASPLWQKWAEGKSELGHSLKRPQLTTQKMVRLGWPFAEARHERLLPPSGSIGSCEVPRVCQASPAQIMAVGPLPTALPVAGRIKAGRTSEWIITAVARQASQ